MNPDSWQQTSIQITKMICDTALEYQRQQHANDWHMVPAIFICVTLALCIVFLVAHKVADI